MHLTFDDMDLAEIEASFAEHWGGLVVTPEGTFRAQDVLGVAAILESGERAAIATWVVESGGGQVVTLDAIIPGQGYGRSLLAEVERRICESGGRQARLFSTNDNVVAIRIYLLAGYRVTRIFPDSMDAVRALKPGVPLAGEFGLPLRDMWEFVKVLAPATED